MRNPLNKYLVLIVLCLSVPAVLTAQVGEAKSGDDNDTGLRVFIPNAFTPNADMRNDFWKPVISGPAIERYELVVLDRMGDVMFETTNPEESWTGSSPNSAFISSPSVFLYELKLNVQGDLETYVYRGHITMVR